MGGQGLGEGGVLCGDSGSLGGREFQRWTAIHHQRPERGCVVAGGGLGRDRAWGWTDTPVRAGDQDWRAGLPSRGGVKRGPPHTPGPCRAVPLTGAGGGGLDSPEGLDGRQTPRGGSGAGSLSRLGVAEAWGVKQGSEALPPGCPARLSPLSPEGMQELSKDI